MTPDVLIRPRGAVGGSLQRAVTLEDRYELDEGVVHLSGVHALVRALLDQLRAERGAGPRTGATVSGRHGSPRGGLARELARVRALAADLGLRHQPAVNEELGAAAVW